MTDVTEVEGRELDGALTAVALFTVFVALVAIAAAGMHTTGFGQFTLSPLR